MGQNHIDLMMMTLIRIKPSMTTDFRLMTVRLPIQSGGNIEKKMGR